jgi:PAS domain S-box-containing protein
MLRMGCLLAIILLWLTSASAGEKVSIQLRWDHQFQFAGYYAARWQGYYEEAGFDVDIRSAITPEGKILHAVEEVAGGRADFGVGAADILMAIDRGVPLVVLASIFQQSAAEFYIRKDAQFSSPADLLKLRVARIVDDLIDVEFQAMLLSEGIDPEKITPYPHQPGTAHLAEGRVDVVPGYRISLPYEIEQEDISVKTLRPITYGIDFYGDSLFTHRRMIKRSPEAVERFTQATLKGWKYALDHPEEISDKISSQLPRTARIAGGNFLEFNRFQSHGVKDLMLYPIVEVGHTNPNRWRRMHEFMQQINIVKKQLDLDTLIFDPGKLEHERENKFYKIINITLYVITGIAFFIYIWTLTLRKTVAQKTRELNNILEILPIGVWISDKTGTIVHGNPAGQEIWAGARYVGPEKFHEYKAWWVKTGKLIQPEDWAVVRAVKKGEVSLEEEIEIECFDGTHKIILNWAVPMRRPDGKIEGVVVINQDITGRKRAEELLRHNEERLRNIFENVPIGMFQSTSEGKFIYVNAAMSDMLGYASPEELIQTVNETSIALALYEDPEKRPLFVQEVELSRGRWKMFENRYRRKDNCVIDAILTFCEQTDPMSGQRFLYGFLKDITARKRAEAQLKQYSEHLEEMVQERTQELHKAQEELLVKERLAVLGHFAGSISHEIRNPLSVIDTSVYLLKMKLGQGDEKIRQHMERITLNVHKATAIIESLLNLTRMEKPKTEEQDLIELIHETLPTSSIPDTVEIAADFPEDKVWVNVDKEQIRMALKNIIRNAVQAMNNSGKITVTANPGETGNVELVISDTGPGISQENIGKVFEPLFTTKAQGIGFGLAITQMIIESHGGTIRAESEPGKGASFILTFPTAR